MLSFLKIIELSTCNHKTTHCNKNWVMPRYDYTSGNYRNPPIKFPGNLRWYHIIICKIHYFQNSRKRHCRWQELSSRRLSLFSSERVTQRRKLDPREKNKVWKEKWVKGGAFKQCRKGRAHLLGLATHTSLFKDVSRICFFTFCRNAELHIVDCPLWLSLYFWMM